MWFAETKDWNEYKSHPQAGKKRKGGELHRLQRLTMEQRNEQQINVPSRCRLSGPSEDKAFEGCSSTEEKWLDFCLRQ